MHFIFILFLCITTLLTATIAVPLKDDENIIKKPDIEDFIDRLLTSEKFEQLADKIAERAADKIITLQQDTSRFGDKKPNKRARNDEEQAPKHHSSQKTKHVKKEKDDSDKDEPEKIAKEKEINKNDKKRSKKVKMVDDEVDQLKKELAEKTKIDTIAAIHKISEFPAEQLSLNYKHFTARETTSTKSPKKTLIHKKEKEDNSKKSHRKHKSEEGDYESFLRAQLTDDAKSQEIPKYNKNKKDSDISIDAKKESSEMNAEIKNRHNKKKKIDLHNNEKTESESSSSHESSASDENESLAMRQTNEEKIKKIIKKADNSIEKNESGDNEVHISTPTSLRAGPTTMPFGFADTDKSSQESASDDNKVSNIADSAKLNEKLKEEIKTKENKQEKHNEKNKDEKDNKINESEKTDTIIDTKHKIREKNGKLYAFAISPDYEEYHEKLSSILESVKNNQTKRSLVNKDLLDLVE